MKTNHATTEVDVWDVLILAGLLAIAFGLYILNPAYAYIFGGLATVAIATIGTL